MLSLALDDAETLWVGTAAGLSRQLPDDRWQSWRAADGLGSSQVYAILPQPDGTLLLAGSGGLSLFDPNAAPQP